MQILTESEYETLVEDLSHQVYDPLSDSHEVCSWSLELLDLVLDGESEEARERVREKTREVVEWEHGLDTGPRMGTVDNIEPITAGSIVQHSGRNWRIDRQYREEEMEVSKSNARKNLQQQAAGVLFTDVKAEVANRIRASLDALPDDQEPSDMDERERVEELQKVKDLFA